MLGTSVVHIYAVNAQTSLAPLSWFPGSRIPTAHVHQCCRFQRYANSHCHRVWNLQSVNHIPGIHDNGRTVTVDSVLVQGRMLSNHFCKTCQNWLCPSFEFVQFDESSLGTQSSADAWIVAKVPANAIMQCKQRQTLGQKQFDTFYKIDCCIAIHGRIWNEQCTTWMYNNYTIMHRYMYQFCYIFPPSNFEKFKVKPELP